MRQHSKNLVVAVAACLLLSTGVRRDAAGVPIHGAGVRLKGKSGTFNATTGTDGQFRIELIPVGQYQLSVDANHDKISYAAPINIAATSPAVVITLSAQKSLSVTSVTDLRSANGGEELPSQTVSVLPLNKRDFSQLLLLAAGTMTDANGATNFTQQFAINGQRGVEAVFAMDGADISDPEMGGSTFSNFNVDAVEEIRSSSGWGPAEIGRGAAGFTTIVTRSGSSGFHGSVFEFVRNSAFDARNYFDHATAERPERIPPFRRNEFGFTNGGPVLIPHVYDGRGKTFYFGQYQGFRQVLGTTQVFPVPTAEERQGIDTTAYPGDTLIVPVDPGIAKVLARYPLPNEPQGPFGARTYAASSKVATSTDQFSVRIDHRISDQAQLMGRFSLNQVRGPTTNPDQTAIDPTFGVKFLDHQRSATVKYGRTISPRLSFTVALGYIRSTPIFPTINHTQPAIGFGDGLFEGFNSADGSIFGSYGNVYQLKYDAVYARGSHSFKWGAEIRANRDATIFGTNPNGAYTF